MPPEDKHIFENVIVAISFTITLMIIVALLFDPANLNARFKQYFKDLFKKEKTFSILNGLSFRKNIWNLPYIIQMMYAFALLPPLLRSNREYWIFTSFMLCIACIALIVFNTILRYNDQYKLCVHLTSLQTFIYTVMCHTGIKRLIIFNIITFIVQYITIHYQWLSNQTTLKLHNTSHHISILCGIMYLNTILVPFYAHLYVKFDDIIYFIFGITNIFSILCVCIYLHCLQFTNNSHYQWCIIDTFQNKDSVLRRIYCCLHNYCHHETSPNTDVYINIYNKSSKTKLFYKHLENSYSCLTNQSSFLYAKCDEDKYKILDYLYEYSKPYGTVLTRTGYFMDLWMKICIFNGNEFHKKWMGYLFHLCFVSILMMEFYSIVIYPILFILRVWDWIYLYHLYLPYFILYGFIIGQSVNNLSPVIYFDFHCYGYLLEIANCRNYLSSSDKGFEIRLKTNKVIWDILGHDIGKIVLYHLKDGDYLSSLITTEFKSLKVDTENFVPSLNLVEQYRSDDLLDNLLKFAKHNEQELHNTQQFQQLPFFVKALLTKRDKI